MPNFVVIRERGPAWDWSKPMRRQAQWDAHAAFMDELVEQGFIVAGGPLGGEDDARRIMHLIEAPDAQTVERRMDDDPWTPMNLLRTISLDPWTVLLGTLT
jgi:uncharacterized protein YciI